MWKRTRRKKEQGERMSGRAERNKEDNGHSKGRRSSGWGSNLLAANSSEKLHWGYRKCSFKALLWKPLAVVSVLMWFCLSVLSAAVAACAAHITPTSLKEKASFAVALGRCKKNTGTRASGLGGERNFCLWGYIKPAPLAIHHLNHQKNSLSSSKQ